MPVSTIGPLGSVNLLNNRWFDYDNTLGPDIISWHRQLRHLITSLLVWLDDRCVNSENWKVMEVFLEDFFLGLLL